MCGNCTVHGGPHISPRESRRRREPSTSARVPVVLRFASCSVWKIEVAGDVGNFICGADGKWLGTQGVFVAVMAGLAAQAAHFASAAGLSRLLRTGPPLQRRISTSSTHASTTATSKHIRTPGTSQ